MADSTATPAQTSTPAPAIPLAHELRISKDASEWLKTLSPGYFQTNEDIEKAWSAPQTQFTLTLLKDPEFKQAKDQIRDAHLGDQLIGYELVFILLLWIFRAWRLGKAATLLTRIWTQAWIAVVFWLIAIFGIPWIVYGNAYQTILKVIGKAFARHFFT
jgi:hypothetical protein